MTAAPRPGPDGAPPASRPTPMLEADLEPRFDAAPDAPPGRGRVAVFTSVALHILFVGLVVIIGFDAARSEARPAAPLVVADWTPAPVAAVLGAPPELPLPGGALQATGPARRRATAPADAALAAATQLDRIAPVPQPASERPAPRLVGSLDFGSAPAGRVRISSFAMDRARVAFVLDAGGPMVPALQSALAELGRRMGQLEPTQTYSVVVVRGDGCEPVPGTPSLATRESLERTLRWLDEHAEPRGVTSLATGLECAWRGFDPDAVCLIARGQVLPRTASMARKNAARNADEALLAAANRLNPVVDGTRRARFLCLELLDAAPDSALAELGRTHGGPTGYQHLDRSTLGLQPRTAPGASPRAAPRRAQ